MGRYVFGTFTLLLGIATIALHDQLISGWNLPHEWAFILVTSAALIIGGFLIQVPGTRKIGALIVAATFFIFALTWIPSIVAQPGQFWTWGNIFYRLTSICAAVIAYCMASPLSPRTVAICKTAVILAGFSNVSFGIEQLEYLARMLTLVPAWMPGGGMFWTIATTVAFFLAAIAMVTGIQALLATRLSTLMMALFGVVIWVPALIVDPKTHSNWGEGLETFAIAGALWIIADYLAAKERDPLPAM